MPVYPGGNDSLMKEITSHINYPQACIDSNIQGKVYLRFIINTDGGVSDMKVVKTPHPLLGIAAMDAAGKIGKFNPGMKNGRAVRVWYSVPVSFKIKTSQNLVEELLKNNPGLIDSLDKITKEAEEAKVFTFVEQLPEFPGGDGELVKYLQNAIQYPRYELNHGIDGKVITRFVIMEDGSVQDAVVIKGVSPGLDAEALRVVGSLPRFKPGQQEGKPVKVYFQLPVVFRVVRDISTVSFESPYDYYKGGQKAFDAILENNLVYPTRALKERYEAIISVRCTLNDELKMEPEKVVNDIDSIFSAEACRVIRLTNAFNPDIKNTKFNSQVFTVDVEFGFDKRHLWRNNGGPDASTANSFTLEGAELYKAGKFEKAIESFDAAVRYYSMHADAFYNRALTEYKMNDAKGACDDFRRAFLLGDLDAQKGIELSCH
jgi:TonB family protein